MMRAGLGERVDRAGADHLHRDIAERGRFDRAGEHGAAGRVGGELIQQPVARSAADDVDLLDGMAGQLLERVEHEAVLERQALENRARVAARPVGLRLAGLAAVVARSPPPCRAGAGSRVVRIEQHLERLAIVAGRDSSSS